jgi:excisionase family DNA binding protein
MSELTESMGETIAQAVAFATATASIRVLDVADVAQVLGVSRPTIYQWMAAGNFPQPRQLSIGRSGWLIEDVRKYLDTLPLGVAISKRHRAKGKVP